MRARLTSRPLPSAIARPPVTRGGKRPRASVGQPFKRVERALATADSVFTTAAVSARMGRVRQRGTSPELAVRLAVRVLGMRYRVVNRDLPGSPDIANRARRVAIFVHGCYWHRHSGCAKATTPRANRAFWLAKFARNRARDRASVRALEEMGFRVVVIWECETRDSRALVERLRSELGR